MAKRLYAMRISDKDLDEFIKRWEAAFGETLTRTEAQYHASRLLTLYRLISQPLPDPPTQPSESPPADQTSPEAS